MRSIIHFRIKSFFASLEQLRRPELVGKPVVVLHNSGRSNAVVSASQEAVRQGVREAMTARHAGRCCPEAIFLPARWEVFREASDTVMDILYEFSPLLETQGLDKAYMDFTGSALLFGTPKSAALEAQHRIERELGVLPSVGIATNKLCASVASSVVDVGGFMEVEPEHEREFLLPLPVGCLWGVDPKIEKRLANLGVNTVGELATIPERLMARQFGILGSRLRLFSLGIDYSPVMALYPPAMIEIEHTFDSIGEDTREPEFVEPCLLRMCDLLAMRLRKRNQKAREITMKLEFEDLPPIDRTYSPKNLLSSAQSIFAGARRILRSQMQGARLSSVRLTLSGIEHGEGMQLSFMGDAERRYKLDAVLENIRARFGEQSISLLANTRHGMTAKRLVSEGTYAAGADCT